MNRYSLWQYILIAITLAVGLLYTVPNFYGEVPAVQVQPQTAFAKIISSKGAEKIEKQDLVITK